MRGLDGLIRLWKWRLDEKRRIVVDLEILRADIERQIGVLDAELYREKQVAAQSVEAGFVFANYRKVNREKRERLVASREDVIQQIAAAQEEVNAAFRELKKYDLVKESRLQQMLREQAMREQAELDEIGLQGFRRRQEQPDNTAG